MNKLALALLVTASLALSINSVPAVAWVETPAAKADASDAAADAHGDMIATFGVDTLEPGQYLWDDAGDDGQAGEPRLIVSLSNQMAYLYRGDQLAAVTTMSSGKPGTASRAATPRPAISRSSKRSRCTARSNMTMRRCRTCSAATI